MMHPLLEAWQGYERKVIPKEASDEQRQVMRESFYAGAFAAFSTLHKFGVPPERVDAFRAELQQFANLVMGKYDA
jgi:hypothetical protein